MDDALLTRPYYRSTYVMVTRADRALKIDSLYDPRLKDLRIGLHIVEDDYAPPGHLLAAQGLVRVRSWATVCTALMARRIRRRG